MRGGVYTAVDWCNALSAHDDDYLRILSESARARTHINDECILDNERVRPVEYATYVGASVARIRVLLEAGAEATTDALLILYSGDQWQDYEEEAGALLYAYGAQHDWNSFRLYLRRQQTEEDKIAAFVKHPEFIDSGEVEEKYEYFQAQAYVRRCAARSAAQAVVACAKYGGALHKDVAGLLARTLISPACASLPQWKPRIFAQRTLREWMCLVILLVVCQGAVIILFPPFKGNEPTAKQWRNREAEERRKEYFDWEAAAAAPSARAAGAGGTSGKGAFGKPPPQVLNPGGCPMGWGNAPCDLRCVVSLFPPAPAYNRDTEEMYPPHQMGVWMHASQYRHEECDTTHVHMNNHHYGGWNLQDTADRVLRYACPQKTGWRFSAPAERVVVVSAGQRPADTTTAWYCPANHSCVVFWDANKCIMDEHGFLHRNTSRF